MKRENWKYIILGVGLGFLVAAAMLLVFNGKEKETLTDREIIERARALGMIFLTETLNSEAADPAKNSLPSDTRTEADFSLPPKNLSPAGTEQNEADVITEVITEPDNVPSLVPPTDPNRPKTDPVYHDNNYF